LRLPQNHLAGTWLSGCRRRPTYPCSTPLAPSMPSASQNPVIHGPQKSFQPGRQKAHVLLSLVQVVYCNLCVCVFAGTVCCEARTALKCTRIHTVFGALPHALTWSSLANQHSHTHTHAHAQAHKQNGAQSQVKVAHKTTGAETYGEAMALSMNLRRASAPASLPRYLERTTQAVPAEMPIRRRTPPLMVCQCDAACSCVRTFGLHSRSVMCRLLYECSSCGVYVRASRVTLCRPS
jgi:hypothetical protein